MADEPLPFDPANLETMQVSAKTTRAMIALVAIFQDLEHGRLTAKDAKGRVQNEIQQVRKDCGDEKKLAVAPRQGVRVYHVGEPALLGWRR